MKVYTLWGFFDDDWNCWWQISYILKLPHLSSAGEAQFKHHLESAYVIQKQGPGIPYLFEYLINFSSKYIKVQQECSKTMDIYFSPNDILFVSMMPHLYTPWIANIA